MFKSPNNHKDAGSPAALVNSVLANRVLSCWGLAAGLSLLTSLGCGPAPEPVARVHGTVTFRGQPVPKGNVFFDPDGTKGTSGKQGFAGIVDGKFDTAAPDGDGIKKGDYTIRVQAFDGKPLPDLPFGTGLTSEYIDKRNFAEDDNEYNIVIGK